MANKRFHFKCLSLLVVLAVFLSTFCAALPSVNAAARGAWAPNTAYAVNDTVTYSGSTYTSSGTYFSSRLGTVQCPCFMAERR